MCDNIDKQSSSCTYLISSPPNYKSAIRLRIPPILRSYIKLVEPKLNLIKQLSNAESHVGKSQT